MVFIDNAHEVIAQTICRRVRNGRTLPYAASRQRADPN